MITFINYKTIMAEAKGKARTKIDGKLQDVETIYDVFKGAGTYFAPEIAVRCSKTATQVAYYIYKKLSQNQTSFRIVTKEVIKSGLVNAKTPDRVRDAIKELIKAGVMIAWKDIEGIDEYNFDIDSKYYLLNPLVIRRCSTNAFKRNCETTKDRFNNSKQLWINEYDAIVYNFDTNVLQITYN